MQGLSTLQESKIAVSLRHIGLTVRNLERSRKFYQELFGFVEARRMDEKGAFLETVHGIPGIHVITSKLRASLGGILLELLEYQYPESQEKDQRIFFIGCSHFSVTVPDAAAQYKRMVDAGVKTVSPPALSDDGRARVFICKDPDGIVIEVVEEIR